MWLNAVVKDNKKTTAVRTQAPKRPLSVRQTLTSRNKHTLSAIKMATVLEQYFDNPTCAAVPGLVPKFPELTYVGIFRKKKPPPTEDDVIFSNIQKNYATPHIASSDQQKLAGKDPSYRFLNLLIDKEDTWQTLDIFRDNFKIVASADNKTDLYLDTQTTRSNFFNVIIKNGNFQEENLFLAKFIMLKFCVLQQSVFFAVIGRLNLWWLIFNNNNKLSVFLKNNVLFSTKNFNKNV